MADFAHLSDGSMGLGRGLVLNVTADALSDLGLFAVCAGFAWHCLSAERGRAGIGVACVLIGVAAFLGVFRFSSWAGASEAVRGAHQFMALVAAVGAFPIWAMSLAEPDSAVARRLRGAWWVTFVLAGAGVALVVMGVKLWQQAVPLLCGLWIAYTMGMRRSGWSRWCGLNGALCLMATFAVALLIREPDTLVLGLLSKTQMLHYLLAAALLGTCWPTRSPAPT